MAWAFGYRADVRMASGCSWGNARPISAATESGPKRQGVSRSIARSDHGRGVSTPRCARDPSTVTAIGQRLMTSARIVSASSSGRVEELHRGPDAPCGSRLTTHRIGGGVVPLWDHSAVPLANSSVRSDPSYRRTVTARQTVFGSARTAASLGRRRPTRRGWPIVPRPPRRRGRDQAGIEPQRGDQAHPAPAARQPRRDAAVRLVADHG